MGYKTFEDMKDKIPDGAAYYQNESEMFGFAWFNADKNKCHFNGEWYECSMEFYPEGQILPIPTQLDSHLGIDSGEWKNGDECEHGHYNYSDANKMTYIGAHPFVIGKHVCLSELKGLVIVDSIWLRKPETPQQREDRERLEAIETMCNEVDKLPHGEAFAAMATLYDLGYRKQ